MWLQKNIGTGTLYPNLLMSCKYLFLRTYSDIFDVFNEASPVVLSKVLDLVLESIQLEF